MRIWALIGALMLLAMAGCAGQSAVVLTYDNIAGASAEVRKGVDALDAGYKNAGAQKQDEVAQSVADSVIAAAKGALKPDELEAIRTKVKAKMQEHLTNLAEQERRRRAIMDAIYDNLDFINQLCDDGRNFELYRSSVGAQWKAYIQSTVRARMSRVPATEAEGGTK